MEMKIFNAYTIRTSSRAVKKTLAIPELLNEEAAKMGVSFSQVLRKRCYQNFI